MPRTSVGLKRFCQARAGELISNIPGAFFGGVGETEKKRGYYFFWGKVVSKEKFYIYGWGCDFLFWKISENLNVIIVVAWDMT